MIKNLTGKELKVYINITCDQFIRLQPEDGNPPELLPEVEYSRCSDNSIPLFRQHILVGNLPAPEARVMLVVSKEIAELFPDRDDLLFPGADVTDDETGEYCGCLGLHFMGEIRQ